MSSKAIIFLADGMADEPLNELNGRTPLEAVETPAMDSIAKNGQNGNFLTLPDGLPTSSDVANMSVLGFCPEKNYPGRGPIEAVSQGITIGDDDVVFRCNLVYASEDGVLRDYSAGHINDEDAAQIMFDLQQEFGGEDLTFHSGVSYRNLLILHGKKFSADVDYFKPDSSQDIALDEIKSSALNNSVEACYTVKFLHELEEKCAKFLSQHRLNIGKKSPANRIWPWSPGNRPNLLKFSELYPNKKGAIISAVDVIKGLGKCSDMTVIEVEGATGFLDTNYAGKAAAAIKAIEDFDLVYLHVEAIDECSHLGDIDKKMQAIYDFENKIVAPVMKALEGRDINFAVLPDHPVPIKLRCHTTTPVPLAICGPNFTSDNVQCYSERCAKDGSLGLLKGKDLIELLLK